MTPRAGRPRLWLLAGTILVAGLAASLLGAQLWGARVRAQEHQRFRTSATDVAESLEGALRGDAQFVTSLRAVMSLRPGLSATGFQQSFATLEGHRQGVGSLGTLVVRSVKPGGLAAFQHSRDADHAFRALVDHQVQPLRLDAGVRHCLLAAGIVDRPYSPFIANLLQGDWCDPRSAIGGYGEDGTVQARLTQLMTDSGGFVVYPVTQEGVQALFIEGAFYRRAASLSTLADRRAAVLGWVSSSFDIPTLILESIHPHTGLSVSLHYSYPGRDSVYMGRAGVGPVSHRFAQRTSFQIDGTWTAVVSGSDAAQGLSATLQIATVLLGGAAVSILAFILVLTLARSRAHALDLAEHRTRQLRHQALHDELTGLPNRALALTRAREMLEGSGSTGAPAAVIYFDLDGFKQVNDTFGHSAGDELLRVVARRLTHVVRGGDLVARLGGDEFVVLPDHQTVVGGLEALADRILVAVRRPLELGAVADGHTLTLTASIGIASGLRSSAEELLRDADVALYEAKAAGRNRYVVFHPEMQCAIHDRLTTELDLYQALEHKQFHLEYQPIYDLRSQRIAGVEALLRWTHPLRGTVAPAEFIPIAESNGLIVEIGRWALHEACRQAAAWSARESAVGVAVNVSARQLESDALLENVSAALQASALDPGLLTIELTESVLMRDPAATADRLRALKQLGVRLAIDDFGTGYSSLAYLREFPVDALKIDRSFVRDLGESNSATAMINSIARLAQTLGIATVAEGIEDSEQLRALAAANTDYGQGFLLSRPLGAASVEDLLRRDTESHGGVVDPAATLGSTHAARGTLFLT